MNTKTRDVLARAKRASEKYENTPTGRPISDAARKYRADAMTALNEREAEIAGEIAALQAERAKIQTAYHDLQGYYHW